VHRSWRPGCAGARAQRHQAAQGTACLSSARPAPGRGNARRGQHLGNLGKGSARIAAEGRAWSGGSAAAAPMARWCTVLSCGHGAPIGARGRGGSALNRCSSPTWSEEGRRGDTHGQELV
jgi:hypothetical protein